jgi:hypothetical protein
MTEKVIDIYERLADALDALPRDRMPDGSDPDGAGI